MYIKKILALSVLLCFMLAGCNAATQLPEEQVHSDATSTGEEAQHDLVLTTRKGGALDVVAIPSGAYFASASSANTIAFYDDASDTIVPLCNRPECQHNAADCTAFVETSIYNLFVNSKQDKLFLNYTLEAGADTEYPISSIYSMDLNGGNRREVFRLSRGTMYRDFAFDGNTMYFFYDDVDDNGSAFYNLVQLDYQTGEHIVLDVFHERMKLVGAFDNFLILESYNGTLTEFGAELYTYNIATKEKTPVYSYSSQSINDNNAWAVADGAILYALTSNGDETATLQSIDLRTGAETTLANAVPYFGMHSSDWEGAEFADGYMFIESLQPPTGDELWPRTELHAVSLSDGSSQRIDLVHEANQPYMFMYATQNNYIAYVGTNERTISFANTDGTTSYMSVCMSTFKAINKEDFLNSVDTGVPLL